MPEGQDSLSAAKVSSSLVGKIDFDLIERGDIDLARREIARALKALQQQLNQYISRKGT